VTADAFLGLVVAFGVTALLLPLSGRLAHRLGAIVVPRSDRLSQRLVPTLGGLAIAVGIVAGLVIHPVWSADYLAVLVGLGTMVTLGLADDFRYVSPAVRLVAEAGVGIVFTIAVTDDLDPSLRLAAVVVAAVAVPVAVNATNLVDNADGLAASLSLATAVTLTGVAIATGLGSTSASLSLVIAGACLAFLLFNLPPARIFMGDSGSLMLGFTLSATSILLVRDSLLLSDHRQAVVAAAVPLAWALQVGDLAMVFTTRLRRGVSPFMGGVDHTSHRLLAAGLGPWQMLGVSALLAALVGFAAVASTAALGDFRLVAAVTLAGLVLVGLFELLVAWRLPHYPPSMMIGGTVGAATRGDDGYASISAVGQADPPG
jgi:UDP-N-acetylmuramyl pentapeptide phosphotransferase/UDP-N-acetylglucosamine-1-phosphate transferase